MSQLIIAKRYAKALFNLAEEQQALEAVNHDLQQLAIAWNVSSDLQKVVVNTKISLSAKQAVFQELLQGLQAQPLVQTFVRYLLSKRRVVILPEIAQVFKQLVEERLGRLEATVTSAQALAPELVQQMTQKLSQVSGKQVSVQVKVDPALIGGVVTRIGSVVIDGSVRHQLMRIGQSIIRG